MKKLSFLSIIAAILFSSCAKNEENNALPNLQLKDLTAGFADSQLSRTYVEDNAFLRWHEGDNITAFYGNTLNREYLFNGQTGDNNGTFSLVSTGQLGTGNQLKAIYGLYPYDPQASISDTGEISLTLPAVQSYAENSFGRGANSMIAVTESVDDTFLMFKSLCGYLKLYLYDLDGAAVKSITLSGNNGEKIAGAATATIASGGEPVLTMDQSATVCNLWRVLNVPLTEQLHLNLTLTTPMLLF